MYTCWLVSSGINPPLLLLCWYNEVLVSAAGRVGGSQHGLTTAFRHCAIE